MQVEICRFGCPSHCQKPDTYQSREQDVAASVAYPARSNGPRFESRVATEDNNGGAAAPSPAAGRNLRVTPDPANNKAFAVRKQRKQQRSLPHHHQPNPKHRQPHPKTSPKKVPPYLQRRPSVAGGQSRPNPQQQSRQRRSPEDDDELGVGSGYRVISETDLDFKTDFEKGMGITVFQVKWID